MWYWGNEFCYFDMNSFKASSALNKKPTDAMIMFDWPGSYS